MKYLAPVAALPFSLMLMLGTALADDPGADCSGGTTPDGATNFNVFYDNFTVADGASHTCNWSEPAPLPADTFGVYTADYKGGTGPDGRATLTTTHNGVTTVTELDLDDEFTETQYLGAAGGGSLSDEITLATSEDGYLDLDTVDYVLRGTTTLGDVEESVAGLADVEAGIVTHLNATAGLLTGSDGVPDAGNSVGLLGAIGSHTVGVTGHVGLGDGLSLDGGVAGFGQETGDLDMTGVLAAAKLRYVTPDDGGMRWFGALGLAGARMDLGITRHYDVNYADPDATDGATVSSDTTGSLLTASAEAGVIVAPDAGSSFRLSGELAQSYVTTDGYEEAFGENNLFPVSTDDRSAGYTVLKAKAGWTTALSGTLDLTLQAALGHSFANDDFSADILYVGPVTVGGTSESFAEAEARLGWAVAENADLDLFAKGSFGEASGSHVQAGSEFRLKF